MTSDNRDGAAPLLQSACAAIGSLLLVGLLAYVIAAGEWDFAGEPAETEFVTTWQRLNTLPRRDSSLSERY